MNRAQLISHSILASFILFCLPISRGAQRSTPLIPASPISKAWVADNGDGTYKNPIIHADYSDPDVIRVGDDFYLVSSSFNAVPGLPILHSKDLVNWEIIGHALPRQPPYDIFSKPQHGNGVWAPSIRFHNGEFFIFYPDPDRGIYMLKTKDPRATWSEPLLIKEAKGWIDPCPLWDADGKAYLVTAMAASRSGIKSVLIVSRMSPDGTKVLDDGVMVFDGHDRNPTVEGPKFYQRGGYYYIFAPAGGVENGWQLALRSRGAYGPYEARVVLAQGKSPINGPHQGAWVETQTGESWFIHFQDKGAYGRVVHLQPMKWVNDWPVIGNQGEPVLTYKKPNVGRNWPAMTAADSDEFNDNRPGLQWQWHANPGTNWMFPLASSGFIRLFSVPPPEGFQNFWDVPNLLLQKFPAAEFTATTKLTFTPHVDGEKVGLLVMGLDYAHVSVTKKSDGFHVSETLCKDADGHSQEKENGDVHLSRNDWSSATIYLRVKVSSGAVCRFSYSLDEKRFLPIGEPFTARQGRWIGAKVGIFSLGPEQTREMGYADFDWFRIE
jgi:beta-xylosidase